MVEHKNLELPSTTDETSPGDPVWSTEQLVEFTQRIDVEIREWAFRRLILQDPERAKEIQPELEQETGLETDPQEACLLDEPEHPEDVKELADRLQEKLINEEELSELDEMTPEECVRVESILAEKKELFPDVLDGSNSHQGLLILQQVTERWPTDMLLSRLDELLTTHHPRLVWETFEERGDPAALPALMKEWKPGETHASRVVDFLGRLAGVEDQLPDEITSEAEGIREFLREIGTHESPQEFLEDWHRSAPIELTLECNRCDRIYTYDVEQVYVHPEYVTDDETDWIGMVPSKVIRCKHCDAVDDYEFTGEAYRLLQKKLINQVETQEDGRLKIHPLELPNGDPIKRPSVALEKLTDRANQNPDDPDAWEQLGDLALQFTQLEEAENALNRVEELRGQDLTLLLDRADLSILRGNVKQVKEHLHDAFPMFIDRSRSERKGPAWHIIQCLQDLKTSIPQPYGLRATWIGKPDINTNPGAGNGHREDVRTGTVSLEKFQAWKGLAEFFTYANLQSLQIEPISPEEEEEGETSPLRQFITEMYD